MKRIILATSAGLAAAHAALAGIADGPEDMVAFTWTPPAYNTPASGQQFDLAASGDFVDQTGAGTGHIQQETMALTVVVLGQAEAFASAQLQEKGGIAEVNGQLHRTDELGVYQLELQIGDETMTHRIDADDIAAAMTQLREQQALTSAATLRQASSVPTLAQRIRSGVSGFGAQLMVQARAFGEILARHGTETRLGVNHRQEIGVA